MKTWLSLVPFLFCSCFFAAPKFRQSTFTYTNENGTQSFPVIVPKGYSAQKFTTDSAGNSGVLYHYGKAIFYVTYVRDTTQQTQPIDTSMNVPRIHPLGGLIYKGIDAKGAFWREIRRQHLRFGYRDVPRSLEFALDSATNYASMMKVK